jgi:isoleucyl-tRNA synthetase
MGAEILRLWVAAEDYREDIRVSPEILKNVAEGYRKIRNTARFLLSNLYDFDPAQPVPADALSILDRWALSRLEDLTRRVREAYDRYEFHRVYHAVLELCAVDLSAFYLDVLKDRLYCSRAGDPARRAAQSVLHQIALRLALLCAPILCFTAEEIWRHLPPGDRPASVHLAELPAPPATDKAATRLEADVEKLRAVRDLVNERLEAMRRDKQIGSSLETWVTIRASEADDLELLERYGEILAEILIVSRLTVERAPKLEVQCDVAGSPRCERCWRRPEDVRPRGEHPALCDRCAGVLGVA